MPFSWKKKTRRNRFSQLVADHIQSPKRGGSLVVETGFPTSLIDLYVRNRGRFSKLKKQKDNNSGDESLLDVRESDEIIEEDLVVVRESEVKDFVQNEVEVSEVKNSVQNEVEGRVEMAKLNPVLVVMLKVLFVVVLVLVLGTKRFTVGITMLAFVLLLLELVGKVVVKRLETVSESSVYETDRIESVEENASRGGCGEGLEIEEEEEEVESKWDLDEVRTEVLMEIKRKSSRRALMKSRMKKLVPKKLRKSSTGSKEEIPYRVIEEERVKSAQDCERIVFSSECSDSSKGETLRILKRNQDKIVEIEGRSLSSGLSSEIDCDDKELGRGLHKDSGCLVMCLVVLVGLIGGRVLALVLAISWCLMLKTLRWRNVKFPIS